MDTDWSIETLPSSAQRPAPVTANTAHSISTARQSTPSPVSAPTVTPHGTPKEYIPNYRPPRSPQHTNHSTETPSPPTRQSAATPTWIEHGAYRVRILAGERHFSVTANTLWKATYFKQHLHRSTPTGKAAREGARVSLDVDGDTFARVIEYLCHDVVPNFHGEVSSTSFKMLYWQAKALGVAGLVEALDKIKTKSTSSMQYGLSSGSGLITTAPEDDPPLDFETPPQLRAHYYLPASTRPSHTAAAHNRRGVQVPDPAQHQGSPFIPNVAEVSFSDQLQARSFPPYPFKSWEEFYQWTHQVVPQSPSTRRPSSPDSQHSSFPPRGECWIVNGVPCYV